MCSHQAVALNIFSAHSFLHLFHQLVSIVYLLRNVSELPNTRSIFQEKPSPKIS